MTAPPPDVAADLRQAIADLEQKLQLALAERNDAVAGQAATASENARLLGELGVAQDRRNAAAEVLRTIASAPGDAERALQQIAETSARLFGAPSVSIQLAEDGEWTRTFRFGTSANHVRKAVPLATIRVGGPNLPGTVVAENRQINIPDLDDIAPEMASWPGLPPARAAGTRTMCGTPLRREGQAIGVLIVYRDRPLPFTSEELALQQSFADQAAIAIENARLFNEVKARTNDLSESLQQQTAVGDVLKTISRSTFDLQPVLDTLVQTAAHLCDAEMAFILRREGEVYRAGAAVGFAKEYIEFLKKNPIAVNRGTITGRVALERHTVQIIDVAADPEYTLSESTTLAGQRTALGVPLLRENEPIGAIVLARQRVQPFTQKQIDLVTTFADQAVIAIENVRLFDQLRQRTQDLSKSLQQQTATADVLKVISRSAFDLQTVLDTLTESAARLCNADMAAITRQAAGGGFHHITNYNFSVDWLKVADSIRLYPGQGSLVGRVLLAGKAVQIPDVLADPDYTYPEMQKAAGYRTLLGVPLLRGKEAVGVLFLGRKTVEPFSQNQIELVSTFADQAVIAIENVRLFDEVQAKTRDLTEALTYQTGSGNILRVIASSPTDVKPVLNAIVESACELCEADDALATLKDGDELVFQAQHGSIPVVWDRQPIDRYGVAGLAVIDRMPVHVHDLLGPEGEQFPRAREFARKTNVRTVLCVPLLREGESIGVIVLRRTEVRPFSDKQIALLQTFADQAVIAIGNVRLFEQVQTRTRELAASLDELRAAQDRLVQTEKLASLGQLTAGIAHEIKNPLNFVNNFAALSAELTDELNEVLKPAMLAGKIRGEVDELTGLLKDNLLKVVQHGKRADSIVKNMLLHSREGSGDHRTADINALVDESLNLAYHGARAEKPQFNVTLRRDLDTNAGMIELFPQEITRVFLNLISNGFYAVAKRKADHGGTDFEPLLAATTRDLGNRVEIRIRDNGTGIPPEVKEKMFNPFFTTKPAGEGTGLGLSMSHDIIVKQHGGTINVETVPGEFTEFTILLPRTNNFPDKTRG